MHLEDFVADTHGGRFVAGEERVVFRFVEEVALKAEEMGGEEDVGAEGREEGVEVRRGGGCELGEPAWGMSVLVKICMDGERWEVMVPCFRRKGVAVKERACDGLARRRRQGRQQSGSSV